MTITIKEDRNALRRFHIRKTLEIRLTRLKVNEFPGAGGNPYVYDLSMNTANQQDEIQKHLQTLTRQKPFSCKLCNYKSTQWANLNTHIMTHTGEKHYNCAFCAKPLRVKAQKFRHEKICKLNPRQSDQRWVEMQRAFKCQLCPYASLAKSYLKQHMKTHTGEKPFPCNLCNKTFGSKEELRCHIFTHTREKPHCCQFCKRGFAHVAHQKRQEKICKLNPKQGDLKWVEEQKKFKCHLCNYRTVTKSNLESHLRLHNREKPFACNLCNQTFSRREHLGKHIFTHTREKPHVCPFCKREFSEATAQKRHEKICTANPKQNDAKWVEEQKKCKERFSQSYVAIVYEFLRTTWTYDRSFARKSESTNSYSGSHELRSS